MRVLIVGLGSIGRRHLSNLVTLAEEKRIPPVEILLLRRGRQAITSKVTAEAKLSDDPLAKFTSVNRIEEALDWKPQAVIVSNPTALHLDIAIPAAQAGCHLLLEKPVSHTLHRINLLQDAVTQGGGKVMLGYQFRFHPGLQKIDQFLKAGAIGQPLSVRAQWSEWLPGWHPWEDYRQGYSARKDLGGGVVLTLSHPLDYLFWLLGEVEKVWAFTTKNQALQTEVEDCAEIGLKFKNGTIGSVHLDYNGQPSCHKLEIIGTSGTLKWDNATGNVDLFQVKRKIDDDHTPGTVQHGWEHYPTPSGYERNDLFLAEAAHFFTWIYQEAQADTQDDGLVIARSEYPACTLEQGIYVLKICLAALRASQTSKIQRIE